MAEARLQAWLAEFDSADALTRAAKQARERGYSHLNAYTPFPVEGLAELIGFRERRIPMLTFIGGLSGLVLALAMQVFTNLDYPLDVGARPLLAWPAFVPIGFELMVLGAGSAAVFGMLFLNRLPRLHHLLFEVSSFHFATNDRFFLAIFSEDPMFDREAARDLLIRQKPLRIDPVFQETTG